MVETMREVSNPNAVQAAAEQRFVSGDLIGNTLTDSSFTTIAEVTGTNTKSYAAGFDNRDRRNFQGGSDIVIKNDASTPAEPDSDTKVRYAVYRSSDKEDLVATSKTIRYGRLSNAKSNTAIEDKVATPLMNKVAGDDAVLVVEAMLPDGVADFTVTPGNCAHDLGIAYSQFQ